MRVFLTSLVAVLFFCAPLFGQQQVRVTIENLQPNDGFFVTPVWIGFHDGSFDYFDEGSFASSSLEALAEGGDLTGLRTDFAGMAPTGQDGVLFGPNGFGSGAGEPPVVDPGEVTSLIFDLDTSNRYLSFGTMIIPSNDGFFGNDDGMAIEIFDANGDFAFGGPLEFSLSQVWDGGTEVNDGMGAAFSTIGGTATDEMLAVALHEGLSNFDGTGTAAGTTINFANASSRSVFRLTVSAIPEPNSLFLLGAFTCVALTPRRKQSFK